MTILRWFRHEGERYRIYFRGLVDPEERELVVAGPDWEATLRPAGVGSLEDLSDTDLVALLAAARR